MRVMRLFRRVLLLAVSLALVWFAGFWMFVQSIEALEAEPPIEANTDAIVVLTGGSGRLSVGLELFNAQKAKKLFISGVHPGLTLDRLLGDRLLGTPSVAQDKRACCIKLDYTAETTFGNAWETRAWMEAEGYRSLRLVTANYHMPRSLLIFHAILPGFEIVPHSVTPDSVKLDDWWQYPGTASLLATEYDKYLLTRFRLWLLSA